MKDYPKFADITDIRFRYEVMGESPESICSSSKIFMADLLAYAEREGWTRPNDDIDADELYRQGRQYLTRKATKRAVSLVNKFHSLEDTLLTQLEEAVDDIKDMPDQTPDDRIQSISRATTVYTRLVDNNTIFREAVTAPAFTDRKPGKEMGDLLGDLLSMVDGKGRALPSTDSTAPSGRTDADD